MITLRRDQERHHVQRHGRHVWLTFYPEEPASPLADGFGALETLDEDRLPPGAGIPLHPRHGTEIVTYVLEGALVHQDSTGHSGVIHAGEFRRMTTGHGIRHSEANASLTDCASVFNIWLRPSELGLQPSHEQKRFSVAERRGLLCVVASPDGRTGSLRIHQDALIYSAMLDPGQHVVHELLPERSAWLHVVRGEATFGDLVLTTGDGAGVTAERAISLTARETTEILLLDLHDQPPTTPPPGPQA
jgi:quercetin 2,3-dioxygenase